MSRCGQLPLTGRCTFLQFVCWYGRKSVQADASGEGGGNYEEVKKTAVVKINEVENILVSTTMCMSQHPRPKGIVQRPVFRHFKD